MTSEKRISLHMITDRHCCQLASATDTLRDALVRQVERVVHQLKDSPLYTLDAVVLREKDLDVPSYSDLWHRVHAVTAPVGIPLLGNPYGEIDGVGRLEAVHVPFRDFYQRWEDGTWSAWMAGRTCVGVSVHAVEEAQLAAQAGATYVQYGHVFATSCKAGVAPRGLEALRAVCEAVDIPVYAVGGITAENVASVMAQGAAGVCLRSSLMTLGVDPVGS